MRSCLFILLILTLLILKYQSATFSLNSSFTKHSSPSNPFIQQINQNIGIGSLNADKILSHQKKRNNLYFVSSETKKIDSVTKLDTQNKNRSPDKISKQTVYYQSKQQILNFEPVYFINTLTLAEKQREISSIMVFPNNSQNEDGKSNKQMKIQNGNKNIQKQSNQNISTAQNNMPKQQINNISKNNTDQNINTVTTIKNNNQSNLSRDSQQFGVSLTSLLNQNNSLTSTNQQFNPEQIIVTHIAPITIQNLFDFQQPTAQSSATSASSSTPPTSPPQTKSIQDMTSVSFPNQQNNVNPIILRGSVPLGEQSTVDFMPSGIIFHGGLRLVQAIQNNPLAL